MENVGNMTPPIGLTSQLQFAFAIPQNLWQLIAHALFGISMQKTSTHLLLITSIFFEPNSHSFQ
jgi:hypothetical protein